MASPAASTTSSTTRHYHRAVATLLGTIIGVGMFGVPYVIARSGVAVGALHFLILTVAVLVVHLSYGELALRTQARHRLVGYAERYLGPGGRSVAALSTVLGMYGALLAYLIVSGEFLGQLLGPVIGGSAWTYSIAFGILGAAAITFGLRLVAEIEFILVAFLFIVLALIVIVGAQRVDVAAWTGGDLRFAFLPYGAILFSLGGVSAITEVRDILRGRERLLARAITWGTVLAAVAIAGFALVVIGVSGPATSAEAIAGLLPVLGRSIVALGALLGFLAIATSFLTLGLYLREVFEFDFRRSRAGAVALAVGIPFLIFLLGSPNFTQVILVTGALFGGLDGILVLACALRARRMGDRQPEFTLRLPSVAYALIVAVFLAGIAVTAWELLGRG